MPSIFRAVTTTPRREDYSMLQKADFIYNDKKGRGIAYAKNQCLKEAKDSEYVFLFDDDVFTLQKGWEDYFIELSKSTGEQHFLYMRDNILTPKIGEKDELDFYASCNGCFIFLTKKVLEAVGGFNPQYRRYGFEHASYSTRIHKAGLTSQKYISPKRTGEHIYSMDLDNYIEFEFEHRPTLTGSEIKKDLEYNAKVFAQDTEIYVPI